MIYYEDKEFESWSDVISEYPGMWVVFDKVDFDGSKVNSGHIWAILPDDKIIDFRHKNFGDIELSLRTTETLGTGGYIHGEIVDA